MVLIMTDPYWGGTVDTADGKTKFCGVLTVPNEGNEASPEPPPPPPPQAVNASMQQTSCHFKRIFNLFMKPPFCTRQLNLSSL
jgi:hypothetical protein